MARSPLTSLKTFLALTRAVYAHLRGLGDGYGQQLLKARGIGAQLALAIEKAESSKPGTFAHRSAWLISEDAVRDLGVLVAELPASALVVATGERLRKLNK